MRVVGTVKNLSYLYRACSYHHYTTQTCCSSSSFIVTLSLIRRTACARDQFSGCSSTTNAHSEPGQTAFCCQILTLGALSNRSALPMLVGALFKKFGLFLNTPRLTQQVHTVIKYFSYTNFYTFRHRVAFFRWS